LYVFLDRHCMPIVKLYVYARRCLPDNFTISITCGPQILIFPNVDICGTQFKFNFLIVKLNFPTIHNQILSDCKTSIPEFRHQLLSDLSLNFRHFKHSRPQFQFNCQSKFSLYFTTKYLSESWDWNFPNIFSTGNLLRFVNLNSPIFSLTGNLLRSYLVYVFSD